MPLDGETLAYVAGIFDGEGCVNFTTSGQRRTMVLRAMVRNTDRALIEFLSKTFGGRIECSKNETKTWKESYCWRLDGDRAVDFLVSIEPWAKVKREQIFVARMWDAIRNRAAGKRRDQHYNDMCALLRNQLQWLNRKGKRLVGDAEPIDEVLKTLPVPVGQILEEIGYATH
jgi:hypothetical protein